MSSKWDSVTISWMHSWSIRFIVSTDSLLTWTLFRTFLTQFFSKVDPYVRRIRNISGLTSTVKERADSASRYEGFCIDLLNAIAKDLSFQYEIYEVEDGRFGARDESTGQWHGLVKELMDKVSKSLRGLIKLLIDHRLINFR